jgi:hypothetical protein
MFGHKIKSQYTISQYPNYITQKLSKLRQLDCRYKILYLYHSGEVVQTCYPQVSDRVVACFIHKPVECFYVLYLDLR